MTSTGTSRTRMLSAATGPAPWTLPALDTAVVERLADALGCPRAVAELLVQRGMTESEAARTFLNPTIDDLHDPMLMLGMDVAVARIQRAVAAGEPILIYGDYDVDGTTATVLLKTAIERTAAKDRPAKVSYHVPHRLREGYGMQTHVLGDAASAGIRLVISVDTGIRAFAAAAEAKTLGMDLIVTDHHLPDGAKGVPEAVAVLNPAQEECGYPFKELCGAAVAFKLAHALLRAAAETAEEQTKLRERMVPSLLKLVAIATIADSVPLVGENRVIAALGLRELRNPVQPGLRALMEVARIPPDRSPTATEVGFRIGPRINAAGRMDIASDVVELFLTREQARAKELAEKLDRLNEERRATEAKALEAIDEQLKQMRGEDDEFPPECLVLDDVDWHRGVLGILASRVVERTGRPALVLTHEDGQAHGSGRSIAGFHLLNALTTVHGDFERPGDLVTGALFTRFGGHAHAVGFSLPTERVELLRERMRDYGLPLAEGASTAMPLECDAEAPFSELTERLLEWMERCGPFGVGNREPVFATREVTLAAPVRIIKEKHVCLELQEQGRHERFNALGWSRRVNWPARCAELGLERGSSVSVAYRLRAKTDPQFPGLELELVDLQLT
ncbi:single-stranded-DNA-specific exonuclease RecJ [Edaphobacter sp.]|uniref:single-stranded-DNA-specific exonuclease RecJ n=1 Tax=Edaphobacter sp. TaxID=1934404 RepID=UPI002DBDCF44|nr:single-stranded-DNA-specific exonuclease RecJ [Edaphobacter sp.]HEU5341387.1 single-stranded-DNA-specific exonuclease RecJ [Edaphobacter sp.]